ncbi:MAG: hypothetical protein VXW58_09000 [Pseudomonadota bacterium]|nr:hypothetical protein [Pseudomonadota bacterium]
MIRLAIAAILLAAPAHAEVSKAESCLYQAQVVAAIQKARLDRVKERDVPAAIAETAPTWPESYNAAIPLIAPWVYEKKMRVVRNNDLSEAWNEVCLAN